LNLSVRLPSLRRSSRRIANRREKAVFPMSAARRAWQLVIFNMVAGQMARATMPFAGQITLILAVALHKLTRNNSPLAMKLNAKRSQNKVEARNPDFGFGSGLSGLGIYPERPGRIAETRNVRDALL